MPRPSLTHGCPETAASGPLIHSFCLDHPPASDLRGSPILSRRPRLNSSPFAAWSPWHLTIPGVALNRIFTCTLSPLLELQSRGLGGCVLFTLGAPAHRRGPGTAGSQCTCAEGVKSITWFAVLVPTRCSLASFRPDY